MQNVAVKWKEEGATLKNVEAVKVLVISKSDVGISLKKITMAHGGITDINRFMHSHSRVEGGIRHQIHCSCPM